LIIGITGTSCSGKSFIAEILNKRYNAYIIDCDRLSHKIINLKYTEIAKAFGMSVLLGEGVISRRALAETVFNDPEQLKKLESILYPEIEKQVKEIIVGCDHKYKHIVIDAPTLGKTDLRYICEATIVTKAPTWLRLIRAKRRDNRTIKEILTRFKNNSINLDDYINPVVINTLFNPTKRIQTVMATGIV
jgi:dephospho-CoA kinase